MLREQGRGLVERLLVVVVAVDGVDELDVGVVRPRAPASISSIQAFWLVALAAARGSRSRRSRRSARRSCSTWALAMPSASAWLTNRSRHSGSVSESKVTTLTPASRASLSASQIAVGVVGRDDERADALLGGGVDERHLRVGRRLVGADLLDAAAELLGGPLAAGGAGVEVGVAQVLGQERDRRCCRRRRRHRRRRRRRRRHSGEARGRPREPGWRDAASRCLWIFIVSCLSLTVGRATVAGAGAARLRPGGGLRLGRLARRESARRPRTGSWWR